MISTFYFNSTWNKMAKTLQIIMSITIMLCISIPVLFQFSSIHPSNQTSFYRDMLSKVVEVFTVYRDTPVNFWDVERLVYKLQDVAPLFLNSSETIYPETVQDYLKVMDTLMDDDLREHLSFQQNYNNLGKWYVYA